MQGQITSLCNKLSEIITSQPSANSDEGKVSYENLTEHTLTDTASLSSRKRERSSSPVEEVDEDPTYQQTLTAVRTLLRPFNS